MVFFFFIATTAKMFRSPMLTLQKRLDGLQKMRKQSKAIFLGFLYIEREREEIGGNRGKEGSNQYRERPHPGIFIVHQGQERTKK